ncbi:Bug family tripartite tricarboxylate transporter substrate binding protein [Ottowia thiooxydans]|uniref:Bug family tripartite tricarboxylate transporter substrate binding protein n=1 Tax=Ottowia thiooxydans TaxID=219182 RepID=UPI0004250390|nr:tripartite tricarboxylate transporter substrate binding protein [Ottowia thiooxydans]
MGIVLKKLFAGLVSILALNTYANGYPEKTITIVTPFPAGSTSDLIPRLVAPLVSKSLGAPVIVENRPGANGSLGAVKVAAAKPDGYTILVATTGVLAINQWIYAKLQYSPERDFVPIINAASTPNILVVNPSVKATNLKELVSLAKASPGSLTFASAGNGSTSHLCGATLKALSGIDIVHVPYQGPAPATQDVLGGQVSMICDNLSNVMPHIQSGRLKAIVLTDRVPSPVMPGVSTATQAGYPDLQAGIWYGLMAPRGTPKEIVDKLNSAFAAALKDDSVTARLQEMGLTVIADKPEEFGAFIAQEVSRMKKVVQTSGASVQ